MLCYRLQVADTGFISPTVASLRKASVADNTADSIHHPALLPKNTTGLTLGALAGITNTAVGATALVTMTARIDHNIY